MFFLTSSMKTLKLDTRYNSELYKSDIFVQQFNSTVMNFITAVRCFTWIMFVPDEKAIKQQAMFSPLIRFQSIRSDVMVVILTNETLWQILQLGATRFDLSIKTDSFWIS